MRRVLLAVFLGALIGGTSQAQMRGGGMARGGFSGRGGAVMSSPAVQMPMAGSASHAGIRFISPGTLPLRSQRITPFTRPRPFNPFNQFSISFCDGFGPCFASPFFGGFHHRKFFPGKFFPSVFGFGSGFGYPFYGAYWPYSDYDLGEQYQQAQESAERQAAMTEDLQNQLQNERLRQMQLEQELADMRAAQRQQPPTTTPIPTRAPEPPAPATLLVFRDGHQSEIQNYAIAGGKLYEFGPNFKRTIMMSELDIPATIKANEDRGVIFHVPSGAKR